MRFSDCTEMCVIVEGAGDCLHCYWTCHFSMISHNLNLFSQASRTTLRETRPSLSMRRNGARNRRLHYQITLQLEVQRLQSMPSWKFPVPLRDKLVLLVCTLLSKYIVGEVDLALPVLWAAQNQPLTQILWTTQYIFWFRAFVCSRVARHILYS